MLAQPQAVFYRAWARTSATLEEDFTNHIVTLAAPSGETFVAGSTKNAGGTYSMLLSKYQASGLLAWETEFTVNDTGNVHVGSIALDASGNILVAGSAYNGAANGYDLLLVKFDDSGNEIWHRLHNGPANSYDFGAALACDDANDDVYVTGGAFASLLDMDAVVIRYDSSGAVQWAETWDNTGLTDACGTIALVGGMAIATGFTQTDAVTWEYAALRFDMADGDLLGAFVTNQSGTTIEQVTAVAFDDADNIYITGALGGSLTNLDIKTVKLDADLNIQWTATWNGTANRDDVGRGIAVDDAGNVYVAGHTTNGDDTRDALLLKYASSGTLIWAETRDAEGGHDEFADVALADDGMPFVGGYITQHGNRDFYAALYDTSGTRVWSDWYNGRHNDDDEAVQLTSDGLGNFLLAGPSTRPSGREVLTVKYARHTLVLPSDEGVTAPFVENRGQVLNTDLEPEDDIRYYTRQMYPNVYIFDNQLSYVFAHVDTVPTSTDTMARIDLTFTGLQPNREGVAVGLERQAYHHNYYLGHIPEGRERVALENKVLQPSIYQNIDALYGQGPDGLFIRLICQPGSDPSEIRLQFAGHTGIWVDTATGALVLETALESLVLPAPEAMTIDDEGVETEITAWQPAYVVNTGGVVSITTGSYDTSGTLVVKVGREREAIPCDVYWSTYFGQTSFDASISNDFDEDGYMYATGETRSINFPTLNAIQGQLAGGSDIFISRFSQPDNLSWSTYYGGRNDIPTLGSNLAVETGHDIAADNFGNVYVVGRTSARDFPLVVSGNYNNSVQYQGDWYSRGCIIKLNQLLGTVSWSSFFGDSKQQIDAVTSIKIIDDGSIIIGGFSGTWGATLPLQSDFPIVTPSGAHIQSYGSSFIAILSNSNQILWSTKLGNGIIDQFLAVTVNDFDIDHEGNIYVIGTIAGNTTNDNIPIGQPNNLNYGGSIDAYVMKFNSSFSMVFSFFLGGNLFDWGNSINCVSDGFFVTGGTGSSNFPTIAFGNPNDPLINDNSFGGVDDVFVGKFSFSGSPIWLRFLGDDGLDYQSWAGILCYNYGCNAGGGATVDQEGDLYIVGTASNNYPTVPPSNPMNNLYYHPYINGYQQPGGNNDEKDAFLTIIDGSDCNIKFSTYWGGYNIDAIQNDDQAFSISTYNGVNNELLIYFTGVTNSKYPTIPLCHESATPYFQDILAGQHDGFQSKIYYSNSTVSVSNIQRLNRASVLPNPTSGLIQLKYSNFYESTEFNIRIVDVTGKNILSLEKIVNVDNIINIDISNLPAGYYFIVIESDRLYLAEKIVKL